MYVYLAAFAIDQLHTAKERGKKQAMKSILWGRQMVVQQNSQ